MKNTEILLGVVALGLAICGAANGQVTKATPAANEIQSYEKLIQQASERSNGAAWWRLAMLFQDSARFEDAEHAYGKSLDLMKSGDPVAFANVMDCMGTMYVQMGRFSEGELLERKALRIREAHQDSLGVGLSWMHLAMLSMGRHQNADEEMYAELAVERLAPEKVESAATGEQQMTALTYLSLVRCAAHACKDAMPPLKRAMTIAESSYSENAFPIAYVRFLQGYVDWKRGNERTAAKLMQSGAEGMEAQLGWSHPTFISAMRQYEGFLMATRRNAEAMELREKLARFAGSETVASVAPESAP